MSARPVVVKGDDEANEWRRSEVAECQVQLPILPCPGTVLSSSHPSSKVRVAGFALLVLCRLADFSKLASHLILDAALVFLKKKAEHSKANQA